MKSIQEKAEEYAKTKHTNQNLIEIVSWDFEAGANYVLDAIEEMLNFPHQCTFETLKTNIEDVIGQLKK